MSALHVTAADGSPTVTADELEAAYVLLSEALVSLAEDFGCDAADCIERAMVRLGIS
jgi:hypothetical protein